MLRGILGGVPTSHRALDRATQRRNGTTSATEHPARKPAAATEGAASGRETDHPIEELRSALVIAGLVPPQTPILDRYHRRVDELIGSVPEQARLVVRRYVRWAVSRPLQQKVDQGVTVTPQLVHWPLERARVACQFTTTVATNGGRLGDVSQSQLDAWVASPTGPTRRRRRRNPGHRRDHLHPRPPRAGVDRAAQMVTAYLPTASLRSDPTRHVSAAEQAFTSLTADQRTRLLRGVFENLEYDPDGRPGSEWSSGTTQALGDLFAQFGITFTSPDQADNPPEPAAQTRPDQPPTGR